MPFYSNLLPVEGPMGATQEEGRWTPVTVDVTPNTGEQPLITVEFGATPYDILTVYDGSEFSPRFREHSSVSGPVGNTWTFSLLPVGGWVYSDFSLTFSSVLYVDAGLSYLMPDPPSDPPPALSDSGKLLGRDILFQKGDLQVGPHGDYRTVEGADSLRLAIQRRILTSQREYQLNPGYGAGAARTIKVAASEAELAALKARITDELSRDRRIADVLKVKLERRQSLPGALRVFVSVLHIEESDPVSFLFDLPEIPG